MVKFNVAELSARFHPQTDATCRVVCHRVTPLNRHAERSTSRFYGKEILYRYLFFGECILLVYPVSGGALDTRDLLLPIPPAVQKPQQRQQKQQHAATYFWVAIACSPIK